MQGSSERRLAPLAPLARWVALLFGLAVALLGAELARTYISRLSDHRGFFLVGVEDHVRAEVAARPRRTVVVVVDGLRADNAESMRVVRQLRAEGACGKMDVGLPTVSRPVYAVLSTGLEQDRTGARNNDETSPLAAESIWEVLRRSGLTVEVRSELPWWKQLFPRGFDHWMPLERTTDGFAPPLTHDVTLIHPVYVDENAHDHGAASAEYVAAVRRADDEVGRLLATLDLHQDLFVFTADHGHRARGGHGGDGPEVREVVTCFLGVGAARRVDVGRFDARIFAPTLSVLLGVAFPMHMYADARGDELDTLRAFADEPRLGAPFLDDRAAAIAHFRSENARAVRELSGGRASTWSELAERFRLRQRLRATVVGLVGALVLVVLARRARLRWLPALVSLVVLTVVFVAAYRLLSGGLDSSSINNRAFFVKNSLAAGAIGVVVRRLVALPLVRRPIEHLDVAVFGAVAFVVVDLAHLVAYGWPLGWPLPGPYLFFLPFLASMGTLAAGVDVALGAILARSRTPT